ncbi:MAG: hypothetical protein ACD_74C00158G0007 [uncultured bacterium]|nr:MAG: hypothetical protein ACD_74C00158G0007 [uncultured bacterium]
MKKQSLIMCPGCCWEGEIPNLGEDGQCPKCGYENGAEPFRLLTLSEILTEEATTEYQNVRLGLFLRKVLDFQAAENNRMRDALQRIANWQKAYPLEVFPEPDLKRAHEVLKAAGMGLDGISASNMRHVLGGIKEIVENGLGTAGK